MTNFCTLRSLDGECKQQAYLIKMPDAAVEQRSRAFERLHRMLGRVAPFLPESTSADMSQAMEQAQNQVQCTYQAALAHVGSLATLLAESGEPFKVVPPLLCALDTLKTAEGLPLDLDIATGYKDVQTRLLVILQQHVLRLKSDAVRIDRIAASPDRNERFDLQGFAGALQVLTAAQSLSRHLERDDENNPGSAVLACYERVWSNLLKVDCAQKEHALAAHEVLHRFHHV